MRKMLMVALCACILMVVMGVATAEEFKGDVSAVNGKTGSFTVQDGKEAVDFESETGVLPNNFGVDDSVLVKFKKVNGKKKVLKIIKVPKGC